MMKHTFQFILCSCFIFFSMAEAASNQYKIGIQNTKSTWTGTESNRSFSSSSNILNLNIGLQSARFYGGLNVSGGAFKFATDGPNHPNNVTYDHTKALTVSGVDIIAGFDFWRLGSIFVGVKNTTITWPTNDSISWTGAGGGLSGFYPFTSKIIAHGTFSLMPMFVDANDKAVGRGAFIGFNLGLTYLFAKRFSVNVGLRSENLSYQIEGETNSYSFGGLNIGAGVNF